MSTGVHQARGSAILSEDGIYRYELSRTWSDTDPLVDWIMLNPSTADASLDDPTIRRCIGFSRSWGFGGLTVRNLFALRSTNPSALRRHGDPVGPRNDEHLRQGAANNDSLTVCAWGAHGRLHGRDEAVLALLARHGARPHHLGLTKFGAPRHPLYLPGLTELIAWSAS